MFVDLERILADQVFFHLMHGRRHRPGPSFDDWFAIANQPFIGMDFQEKPARFDERCFQPGDLHDSTPPVKKT